MKILHITKGALGGLDNISKNIFKSIKKEGIDQKILFFDTQGYKLYNNFRKDKLNYIELKGEIIFVNLYNKLLDLNESDLIHIHHSKTWILFTPLLLYKNKTIYSFHGNFGSSFKKSILEKILIYMIVNYCTLFSKKLIFLTEGQKQNIKEYTFFNQQFEKKSRVINNFIDSKTILKNKKDKKYGIIFVGRYTKIKGFEDLMELSKQIKGTNFYLIGDNNFKGDKKNIINIGKVKHNDMIKYYDEVPILILPSYTEAFPMTILEAMARGLVILVSDIPGMREIVKEGRNGYLFPPGDVEKMKELILYLKNKPEEIKRISKNNLKDILRFTAEKQIPRYMNIYAEEFKENERKQ